MKRIKKRRKADRAKKIQELGIRSKDDVWFENYEVVKRRFEEGIGLNTKHRRWLQRQKKADISDDNRELIEKMTSVRITSKLNNPCPAINRENIIFPVRYLREILVGLLMKSVLTDHKLFLTTRLLPIDFVRATISTINFSSQVHNSTDPSFFCIYF